MTIEGRATDGFVGFLKRSCTGDENEILNKIWNLKYREAYDMVSENHKSSSWRTYTLNKEIIERRSKMTKEEKKKLRELIKATEEYLAKLPDIEHDEKQSVYNYYSKDVGWTFLCRDISQAIHTVKEWGNHLSYRLKKAIRNQINEEITDEVYERFMNEEEGDE